MTRTAIAAAVGAALLVATGGAVAWRQMSATDGGALTVGSSPLRTAPRDTAATAPAGERVRVRVLNGTETSGLARRGTFVLRDYGYDVVDYANAEDVPLTATTIEVAPGRLALGERIKRALGVGTVRAAPETLPYVDVIVVLGLDWKPPTQPFRP